MLRRVVTVTAVTANGIIQEVGIQIAPSKVVVPSAQFRQLFLTARVGQVAVFANKTPVRGNIQPVGDSELFVLTAPGLGPEISVLEFATLKPGTYPVWSVGGQGNMIPYNHGLVTVMGSNPATALLSQLNVERGWGVFDEEGRLVLIISHVNHKIEKQHILSSIGFVWGSNIMKAVQQQPLMVPTVSQ
jgi:hypothetical protein